MAIVDSKAGTKAPVKATPKTSALPAEIFEVAVPNHELLKLAYDSYLANSRTSAARTKTRGEVSGGGKKPWKQKGTGKARFGSSRNPIWRGGGIVFGPRGNENFTKKVSTNSKRVAIKQALTVAHQSKLVQVLDIKPTGKTADFAKWIETNKLDRKVLLVVDEKTPALLRATNNLQNVLVIRATYLSVYHILNADHIVFNTAALTQVQEWLRKKEA